MGRLGMENVAALIILRSRALGRSIAAIAITCLENAASREFSVNGGQQTLKI